VLRLFLSRYRYTWPLLALAVAVPAYLIGVVDAGTAYEIAAALGLGALAATLLCLAWDLWLYP
jgi:hypothetical protein